MDCKLEDQYGLCRVNFGPLIYSGGGAQSLTNLGAFWTDSFPSVSERVSLSNYCMRPWTVHQAASEWDSKAFLQPRFQGICAMQRSKQFAYLSPHIRIRKARQYSYLLRLRRVLDHSNADIANL